MNLFLVVALVYERSGLITSFCAREGEEILIQNSQDDFSGQGQSDPLLS